MNPVNTKSAAAGDGLTLEQLKERANYMRGLNLISLCCAESGHSGGTLSMMDILAALCLGDRRKAGDPCLNDRPAACLVAGHQA